MIFHFHYRAGKTGTAIALLLLAACQSAPQPGNRSVAPVQATSDIPPASAVPFSEWIGGARKEALQRGISPGTVNAALGGLSPIDRVIELDRKQPEFNQTFARYLASAVNDARIAQGRALMQKHATLLAQLERAYGVPGRYLVAFWALESDYGRNSGDFPVVGALATLAWEGRRGAYFRDEMFNALKILDRGDIGLSAMKGSWAGAMGQTQFMPSTFLKYAVDQDGDHRMDIWNDVPDALGSTANYLKSLGWNSARGWGQEVLLSPGFDAALSSLDVDATETLKTPGEWTALGVRRADGGKLSNNDSAAGLILPGGIGGPAFLVTDNYRTILKFNRSTSYALAIGYLADRLGGAGPLAGHYRSDDPLRRDDVIMLQRGLSGLGMLKGEPDGVIGSATRQAIRAFQKANGLPPDGYADASLIAAVKARSMSAPDRQS
jgi:membrane-bound lytic murein transglycosylase B